MVYEAKEDIEKIFHTVSELKKNTSEILSNNKVVVLTKQNTLIQPSIRRKGKPKGKNKKNRPNAPETAVTLQKRFYSDTISVGSV